MTFALSRKRFRDFDNSISLNVGERLPDPTGPADVYALYSRIVPQTKMHTLITGGKITPSRGYGGQLLAFRRHDCDLRADCIAIAFMSDKFQGQPMVLRRGLVVQSIRGPIVGCNNRVRPAVVVNVA